MLKIDDNFNIYLTRGDTARLNIKIKVQTNNENDYEINPNDTLRLTIKKSYKLSEHVLQKTISGGTVFNIKPQDTSSLPYGKYVYDVELTTASGDVYTIIGYDPDKGAKQFTLMEEATWQ